MRTSGSRCLTVAEAAGGDWPERARVAAVALVALSKESAPSLGIRLLADLRQVFGEADALATETILKALHALDESPWGDIKGKPLNDRGLASGFELMTSSRRWSGSATRHPRGYVEEDFHEAWLRYLGPPPQGSATSATSETEPLRCVCCRVSQIESRDPLLQAADGRDGSRVGASWLP